MHALAVCGYQVLFSHSQSTANGSVGRLFSIFLFISDAFIQMLPPLTWSAKDKGMQKKLRLFHSFYILE